MSYFTVNGNSIVSNTQTGNSYGNCFTIPTPPGNSGIKIQYGKSTDASTYNATVYFPIAFTNIPTVVATMADGNVSLGNYTCYVYGITTTSFSYRKFYNGNSGSLGEPLNWVAIGI